MLLTERFAREEAARWCDAAPLLQRARRWLFPSDHVLCSPSCCAHSVHACFDSGILPCHMSCFVLSPLQALIVFSSSWLAALVSHDHTLLFIGEHTVLQVCSSCLRAYYPEKAALYPFGASHFCKLSIHDSPLKNIDPCVHVDVPRNQKGSPKGACINWRKGRDLNPRYLD